MAKKLKEGRDERLVQSLMECLKDVAHGERIKEMSHEEYLTYLRNEIKLDGADEMDYRDVCPCKVGELYAMLSSIRIHIEVALEGLFEEVTEDE